MNNRNLVYTIICCLLFAACGSEPTEEQETNTTDAIEITVAEEPKNEETDENQYEDFVPGGYTLYNAYRGDLNRDDYEDAIVILEPLAATEDGVNRAVAILIGDKEGKLTQVAFNKNAALCKDCGGVFGDPIADVVIKDSYFTLEHFGGSGWKWTNDPTFKYNETDKKWYLHKWSAQSFHGGDPENTLEAKMLTTKDFGVVAFEDFNIGN